MSSEEQRAAKPRLRRLLWLLISGNIRELRDRHLRPQDVPPDDPLQDPAPAHPVDFLPTLAPDRRPLTAVSPDPQLRSPLFSLPLELRQQVYCLLFAGREIHLDLRYTAFDTLTPHSTTGVVIRGSEDWRWRLSNCHRHPDAHLVADRCAWGGPPPTRCDIFDTPCGVGGMLGFLLSCRLAYHEGVNAFYGDNTFHITTGAPILHGMQLLVPARLETVTSLIFHVRIETVENYVTEHLGLPRGWNAYSILLGMLPTTFPSLQRLQVLVPGIKRGTTPCYHPGRILYPTQEEPIGKMAYLQPVDSMVRRYGQQLTKCVLMVQSYIYEVFLSDEEQPISGCAAGQSPQPTQSSNDLVQFWRSCGATDVAPSTPELGYWVRKVPNVCDLLHHLPELNVQVEQ